MIPLSTEHNLSAPAGSIQNKIALYKYTVIYIFLTSQIRIAEPQKCRFTEKVTASVLYVESTLIPIMEGFRPSQWSRIADRRVEELFE